MLKINLAGFAELQAGRPAWNFVRELVSNAWDEDIKTCSVAVEKNGNKLAEIGIIDDGPGFANLEDAYTLFGHTPKRNDPTVRGRFNLGEKELAAVASDMAIKTTKGTVFFTKARKLEIKKRAFNKTLEGTVITARINWTKAQVEETIEMLRMFIPPAGVTFLVNGETVSRPAKDYEIEDTLPTVIFNDGAMRPTKRKTKIELYDSYPNEGGWLYEMGIPVQPIDCPFSVNVMQKVPLSPNRENVSDSYLRDIYAIVLNTGIDGLEESDVSLPWVRTAVEDEITTDDTVMQVQSKRYKDAVLWSSDLEANQLAMEKGIEVIHPRTMSPVERSRFEEVGMVHSSDQFGYQAGREVEPIPVKEWDKHQWIMANVARYVWNNLYPFEQGLVVEFIHEGRATIQAGYQRDSKTLIINTAKFMPGAAEADPYWFLALLAHEFSHEKGIAHDEAWQKELLRVTGKVMGLLVLKVLKAHNIGRSFTIKEMTNE